MKILDFDLEGSHFIIEADIAPRQEADDDMECQWLRYDFDNTQVYKETDGAVSPFRNYSRCLGWLSTDCRSCVERCDRTNFPQ